ncbi:MULTISPECIES: hypothetical protein [Burkholderia cepacia complex]|uniref:hypothetical protein n=1 Tax=Burkholderia cepacia complex TaxID=87882 RepID=UPI0016234696|nr:MULTISPECIES: hypothetical protein [Burkholderia cepacia complex]
MTISLPISAAATAYEWGSVEPCDIGTAGPSGIRGVEEEPFMTLADVVVAPFGNSSRD